MEIVEVFLPLDTREGEPISREVFDGIIDDLAERFGGATAFTRAPTEGFWKQGETIERDRVIIIEVIVEKLDTVWWAEFRKTLEHKFEQDEVLIRATPCRKL